MTRLSDQAARLDVGSYPVRFTYRTRYPGSVEVATGVTRIGASSFALNQAAYQDGACVALVDCVMVKAIAGQPDPLTEPERKGLSGLMFAAAETGGSRW